MVSKVLDSCQDLCFGVLADPATSTGSKALAQETLYLLQEHGSEVRALRASKIRYERRAHVQACFDREAELVAAVEDGSYTDSMLDEGWSQGE